MHIYSFSSALAATCREGMPAMGYAVPMESCARLCTQGDCCRQLQDLPGAAQHYQESIQHLQQASRTNDEVSRLMSDGQNRRKTLLCSARA